MSTQALARLARQRDLIPTAIPPAAPDVRLP